METIDFELLMQYLSNFEALVPIAVFLGLLVFGFLLFAFYCCSAIFDIRLELSRTNKYLKRISLHEDSIKYPNGVVYVSEED